MAEPTPRAEVRVASFFRFQMISRATEPATLCENNTAFHLMRTFILINHGDKRFGPGIYRDRGHGIPFNSKLAMTASGYRGDPHPGSRFVTLRIEEICAQQCPRSRAQCTGFLRCWRPKVAHHQKLKAQASCFSGLDAQPPDSGYYARIAASA